MGWPFCLARERGAVPSNRGCLRRCFGASINIERPIGFDRRGPATKPIVPWPTTRRQKLDQGAREGGWWARSGQGARNKSDWPPPQHAAYGLQRTVCGANPLYPSVLCAPDKEPVCRTRNNKPYGSVQPGQSTVHDMPSLSFARAFCTGRKFYFDLSQQLARSVMSPSLCCCSRAVPHGSFFFRDPPARSFTS